MRPVLHRIVGTLMGLVLLCAPAVAGEVRLFAAASLTDAMKEVCARYAQAHPGTSFVQHYASSGALARQIAAGAPADLFLSANPRWMDFLRAEELVSPASVDIFARNTLVFVGAAKTAVSGLADLPQLTRIAIGSPGSVPAGDYARQAMETSGVYDALAAERALVFAKDVRQALVYAERGEVDGAFVYRSDALLARHAGTLFEVPGDLYPPVQYPLGLTAAGAENPEAVAFGEFLSSPSAQEILTRYGFAPSS